MSDNIPNRISDPKNVEGARIRSQSECSAASDDENFSRRQKATFMVSSGLTSASPPKFVSLEEIMQAANSMQDMALVHQIVVDKEFRLERHEPEPDSVHKVIKDTMHRAYWDLLRRDISQDPPNYDHALVLLNDIRQGLFDLLLPQHTKLRQQITEVLDQDLIKQQAEKGILDFQYFANYVVTVMGKLCAPVRDEKIVELTKIEDVVETFKGILETLNLMALDMANFAIEMAKPDIIAHSVELERKKFADFLAIQPDGLEFTRKWILKHLDTSIQKPSSIDHTTYVRNLTKETVIRAAIDLIEWELNAPYPETFMLDVTRLEDLRLRTERLVITGTVLLVTMSLVGQNLNTLASFKESLKEHCCIIMQSYAEPDNLKELLPNIAVQAIKDAKENIEQHKFSPMSESDEKTLTDSIADIGNDSNKIKQLVRQRIKEFYEQIIASSTAAPQKVPAGLNALQKELTAIAGQFLRIISHNSSVFCIYYYDIVEGALPKPA
ncbi:PREDICTED: T-complex protein 11-like protein 1 [Nicrophorus vespilloides]|uniref:T-complex protein 11-like protein 1 n=1 Tax=Nicrophorus vespilloides TaxID=110193 RepID=A0ABM1N800_NICVS|nr:PREDICTED: T-complex protein 11-like protein 1 [Nicrophorus vespilloides]